MTTDLTQVKDGMTSQEIAEITGKRHDAILRDIRNLLSQGVAAHNFVESSYKDKSNKNNPCFNLTPKGVLILASGYNALLREKIINRLEELEVARRASVPAAPPCAPGIVSMENGRESEYIVYFRGKTRVMSSKTLALMCRRNHADVMKSVRGMYKHCGRPRSLFIEVPGGGGKLREILVTYRGLIVLREHCRSLSFDVFQRLVLAFYRARRGVAMPLQGRVWAPVGQAATPVPAPEPEPGPQATPAPPAAPPMPSMPSMPSSPMEFMERLTRAMAVLMGIDPESVSGMMQKGGGL